MVLYEKMKGKKSFTHHSSVTQKKKVRHTRVIACREASRVEIAAREKNEVGNVLVLKPTENVRTRISTNGRSEKR